MYQHFGSSPCLDRKDMDEMLLVIHRTKYSSHKLRNEIRMALATLDHEMSCIVQGFDWRGNTLIEILHDVLSTCPGYILPPTKRTIFQSNFTTKTLSKIKNAVNLEIVVCQIPRKELILWKTKQPLTSIKSCLTLFCGSKKHTVLSSTKAQIVKNVVSITFCVHFTGQWFPSTFNH